MPLTGKGESILKSMRSTYGSEKKARQVFYASRNKGTIQGVEGRVREAFRGLRRARKRGG